MTATLDDLLLTLPPGIVKESVLVEIVFRQQGQIAAALGMAVDDLFAYPFNGSANPSAAMLREIGQAQAAALKGLQLGTQKAPPE